MTGKRRSLTIREENNTKIQNIRSQFLYSNIEIDYTTMINIFIELGDLAFNLGSLNMTDITNVFKKYIENIDEDKIHNVLKDYKTAVANK